MDIWDHVREVQLNDADDTMVFEGGLRTEHTPHDRLTERFTRLRTAPSLAEKRIWGTWAPLRVQIFL